MDRLKKQNFVNKIVENRQKEEKDELMPNKRTGGGPTNDNSKYLKNIS